MTLKLSTGGFASLDEGEGMIADARKSNACRRLDGLDSNGEIDRRFDVRPIRSAGL